MGLRIPKNQIRQLARRQPQRRNRTKSFQRPAINSLLLFKFSRTPPDNSRQLPAPFARESKALFPRTFPGALLLPAKNHGMVAPESFASCYTRIALSGIMPPVKYWEIVGRKLTAAGWTWGYCSAVTHDGWRWIVDVHRGDGRRYIVQSDELLTAFLELESTLL
jgi:hypothetical protein